MATLDYPFMFSNNTVANALEVNADLNAIKSFVETNLVQVDGTVKAGTAAIEDGAVTQAKLAAGVQTAKAINIGTTTTGSPGSPASVSVTQDASSATLSFTVPQGPVGATGPTGPQGPTGPTGPQGPAGPQVQPLGTADSPTFLRVNATGTDPIYAPYLNSSSSTNYVVLRSDGNLCYRSGTSLLKYKEDLRPIGSALDLVRGLKPMSFVFKEEHTDMSDPFEVFARRTQRQYGFVVDDVLRVDSDLVDHDLVDGEFVPRMWKHEAILAYAVKAIQELSDKVVSLEARIADLEGRG